MEQKLQYIVDKIGELNIQITEKQAEQFFRYYELLVEWNGFMNLTLKKWFVNILWIVCRLYPQKICQLWIT